MKQFCFILISLFIISCNDGGLTTANLTKVANKNANNDIIEEGMTANGVRYGTWSTYHDGSRKGVVKTSASYYNNILNGPYFEFDQSGRMQVKAFYNNGKLEGYRATYKFGKPIEEAEYSQGQLNGYYKAYFDDGKLRQESAYTNGKLNGRSAYYNQEGTLTMEYEYKNGEKISGGVVK